MSRARAQPSLQVAVSNKTNSKACDYCRQHGIPIVEFPSSSGELTAAELGERMVNEYKATHMVLAGYVKLVPVEVLDRFRWRAINVHPALLPSFGGKGHYGMAVHRAVLQSGARISGPTVHFVSEQYDEVCFSSQIPTFIMGFAFAAAHSSAFERSITPLFVRTMVSPNDSLAMQLTFVFNPLLSLRPKHRER